MVRARAGARRVTIIGLRPEQLDGEPGGGEPRHHGVDLAHHVARALRVILDDHDVLRGRVL